MFTGAMITFSSARFLIMCKPRTGRPTSIGILWKWSSKLTELAGDGECRLIRFDLIRNFFANKIHHFSRLSIYLGNPLHIISSLFCHFHLFQNAILHKLLKWGFWNFNPIFLRMRFSSVETIFSLVFVISSSWYLHLTLSREFLTFISFKIWR